MTRPCPLTRTVAVAWSALLLTLGLGLVTGWTMRGWLHAPAGVVRIEMHVLPLPAVPTIPELCSTIREHAL